MIRFHGQQDTNRLDAALYLDNLNQLKLAVVIILPITQELLLKVLLGLVTIAGPFLTNAAKQRFHF
jgi:hypothetical protein